MCPYCVWNSMEIRVELFVKQCMQCLDGAAGMLKPRTLSVVLHGKEVGDLEFLLIGTGGRWARTALGASW